MSTSKKHFNGLTPAETERLAILAEECAEVIQMVGKTLRHGYESSHPAYGKKTNRQLLETEVGDMRAIVELMTLSGDLDALDILDAQSKKAVKLDSGKYLHHQ